MQKNPKILKIVIVILLIIAISLAALIFTSPAFKESQVYKFIYGLFNKGKIQIQARVLDPDVKGAVGYDFSRGAIIIAKEEGIYAMDINGNWLWDRKVNLKQPIVKTAGNYFVVADLEGQSVLLFKDNKFQWQKDFPQGVISVDIKRDGVVTVVHGEEGYSGAVSVMNVAGNAEGKGTVKFTRKISSNYIISAVATDSQVCINGFSTTGGSINAAINFLKMSDGQSFSSKIVESQMFNLAMYLQDSVYLFNSEKIMRYRVKEGGNTGSDDSEVFWESNGKNGLLAAAALDEKYLITAVGNSVNGIFSGSRETQVTVYNNNGKAVTEIKLNATVKNIFPGQKNVFALNTGNEVYIYDIQGNLLYRYGTITEIEKVSFINNKEAIVFTKRDMHILLEEVNKSESDTD